MESSTEILRKLLDERGVEYEAESIAFSNCLTWGENDCYSYTEYQDGTVLRIWDCTPEQAIAATLGSGTCKPTEEDCCPICGEDLVKCNVGIGELGGAVELDPPIYHNYCPNCGAKVVER